MKRLLLILVLFPVFSYGQMANQFPDFPIDDQNHIEYQDVIKADSITREKLYSAAKAWFVETFENARFVIQTDNPQTGLVTGRGSYHELVMANPKAAMGIAKDLTYMFLISIECKNGRYRYTINNIEVNDISAEDFVGQTVNKKKHKAMDYTVINHLNNTMLIFEASIKKGMAKTAIADNW